MILTHHDIIAARGWVMRRFFPATVWLVIIVDNTMHLAINALCLKYL